MPSKLYSFFLDQIKLVFWELFGVGSHDSCLGFRQVFQGNSCKNLILSSGRVNLLTNSRWHTELWLGARSKLSIFLPAFFRCFKFVFNRFCPELMSCRQLLKTGTERQCLNGNFNVCSNDSCHLWTSASRRPRIFRFGLQSSPGGSSDANFGAEGLEFPWLGGGWRGPTAGSRGFVDGNPAKGKLRNHK